MSICCDPCLPVQIPGSDGTPGAPGVDGVDGVNAFTFTTAQFFMPAELFNVSVSVQNSTWMVSGQIVFVQVGGAQGYFEVQSLTDDVTVVLKNLRTTGVYQTNSVATTPFAPGAKVCPAGLQGPTGSAAVAGAPSGATYIVQTASAGLSAEQSLDGLATGLLKNTTGTGVLSIGVVNTDYLAPASIGVSVQAFDAGLTSLAAFPTVADRIAYSTGVNVWAETPLTAFARTLLDDATAADMRTTLGVVAQDPFITSIAALGTAADRMIYTTGVDVAAETVLTPFMRTLLDDATAPDARTTLGIVAQDAFLTSIAALGTAADKMIYTTGVDTAAETALTAFARSLLDDATPTDVQATLLINATNQGRIAVHQIIDMNTVGDTGFAVFGSTGNYIIDKVVLYAPSVNMTTAQVAVYTGAGATGTLIAAAQLVSGLTVVGTSYVELTLQSVVTNSTFTAPILYIRVTTPQGVAALAAGIIFGRNLSN